MKRVCVFSGASSGSSPLYAAAARQFGRSLAKRNLGLAYGGSRSGLQGCVAAGVREEGGEVIGVMPEAILGLGTRFDDLSEFYVVDSMHERFAILEELSDGFVGLPGGMGTIAEFFEMMTWRQLGVHRKPCGLLNTGNYFAGLERFIEDAVERKFVSPEDRAMLLMEESPDALLDKFEIMWGTRISGKTDH